MKITTIRQLNEINAKFYRLTSKEFSKSRGFYWQGWKQLEPIIKPALQGKKQYKVLDVGCGNGRFGEFLFRRVVRKKLVYHGLDNSEALLTHAHKRLEPLAFEKEFFTTDIVEALLDNTLAEKLPHKKYHLITLFGVLHHIPSYKQREQLLRTLGEALTSGGYLVLTAWQFLNEERFLKKQIHPTLVGVDPEELEEGDYMIDWLRGLSGHRYCHFTSDNEMEKLVRASGLIFQERYNADGKSGNLNAYVVLRKP